MLLNPYQRLPAARRRALGAAGLVVALLLWSALSYFGVVGPNKLPPPWAVLKAFTYLTWSAGPDGHAHSLLGAATLASSVRIALSALLVLIIGLPIGVLLGAAPGVNAFFSPLLDPFRSAPMAALLPIFVMWFGIDETMKVLFLFSGAVVYFIPMVRDSMLAVPYPYWETVRDLGGTYPECIFKGVLPIAMPRIADAFIVSTSIEWTYVTVAEYVNANSGLGQLIQNARRFGAIDQVFAGILTILVLALLTYAGLSKLRGALFAWEGKQT
jgi:ABC-type nitrate/sulfonate/bicarbonate transport system permease component